MSKVPDSERCCPILSPAASPSAVRTYGELPEYPNSGGSSTTVTATPQAYTITLADDPDVFGGLGVTQVRSFTVANTSASNLTVTTAAGTITIEPDQSFSWGDAESDVLLDVTAVRINIQAAPVNLTWEQ